MGGKKDKKKGKDGGSADKFMEKKTEMIGESGGRHVIEVKCCSASWPCAACLMSAPVHAGTIKTVMELIASKENKTPGEALRPQEVIAVDAQIREHLRNLNADQLELER